MGYSITSEVHDKIEANRAAGRLCQGGSHHCTAPATRVNVSEAWVNRIGEGPSHTSKIKYCAKHSRQYNVLGVNFRPVRVEKLSK